MKELIKNFLAEHGYNMVALPRADIAPLMLLCMEGDHLESLESSLSLLFEQDVAPLPLPSTPTAPLVGQATLNFELKTGLDFLSGIFQKLKLDDSKLKLDANSNRAYHVSFSFEKVNEEKVGLLDLDNFLTGAIPLDKEFRTYMNRLKKSELFVITSTLRSGSFKIQIEDSNGQELALDVALQETGEISATINRHKQSGFSIESPEGVELVFGFKAVQILFDKGKWFDFWKPKEARFRIRSQEGVVLRGEEEFQVMCFPIFPTAIDY